MNRRNFKVGDEVTWPQRGPSRPWHRGRVIWARDPAGSDSLRSVRSDLEKLRARHYATTVLNPSRGYLVEVLGPLGGRSLYAPLALNMRPYTSGMEEPIDMRGTPITPEALAQVFASANDAPRIEALQRELDELKAHLAEYEPESEEVRDESRQRRLDEAQAQLPAGWDLAQDADRDGRYHVHHELWPAAPVYLRLSDDPPWRSWWECGAIVTSGRFDGLADTSLGNYRDLVALLRPGGPTPARAIRDWSGVSLRSDEADLIREILVDWYSWVDARQPMGTHWAGAELNGSRRVDLMHAVAVKFKLLGGGAV